MNNVAPLPVGHLLDGRYRIHKVLGTGGMGRVYLANDTRLANRPVAAKEMIIGDGIEERKAIADFSREASVLARLSHPSIPQVIDYFAEQGRHYLVMEFVAGGDLQHRLDEIGIGARLPEAEVLRMVRQLLDVLQFLHSQKPPIVYRDLKPGNIMIDQHGRAMLIDFGIARFLPPGGRGTQIGSIGYAPPEQYLGKMEPRSDLYALGATMHHLLTGRDPQLEPPFSFPPVRQLAPNISVKTADVIMAALDKDMSRRPQSAREMKDSLPNPEMDERQGRGSGIIPATEPKSAAIGSMATIVLNQPLAPSRSATPHSLAMPPPKSLPVRPAAQVKTQRRLTLSSPPKVPAPPSPTAKTADLNLKKPEKVSAPVSPPAAPGRVSDTKQPAARPASRSRVAAALASVRTAISASSSGSSQARTDSGHSEQPAATRISKPVSTPFPSSLPATLSNGKTAYRSANADAAGAWLVSVADRMQFGLIGSRIVIGRADSNTDAIDVDLSSLRRGADRISKRHAEIVKQGTDYFIRDLGSVNGTYIAGRGRIGRDQLYKLKNRDEVVLGGAKLEFRRG